MNVAVTTTKAEQALAENFEAVAPSLPGGGWVPAARRRAFGAFAAMGLPHRRVEEWKYTDLRALLKSVPKPAVRANAKSAKSADALLAAAHPEVAALDCIRVLVVNGTVVDFNGPAKHEPGAGYHFDALAKVLGTSGFDWIKAHIESDDRNRDVVLTLNGAFVTDGAVLRIEPGVTLPLPIHIVHVSDGSEPMSVATRNLIEVGKGARAVIVESHVSGGSNALLSNAVTEIHVGDGAHVSHFKVLAEGADATHTGSWYVRLGADAIYCGFQASAGIKLARNQIFVTYAGEGSKLDLSGIFLGRGGDHIDTTLVVDHAVPQCESRELFKGVLDGHARGIFQGKIIVRPDAQKTDGKQMAQALMLSPDAEFDSKPELEIYADDVVCGHGSTAAELDEDLLFYCRARGIPLAEARALLISSFIGEAIDKIEHEGVREAVAALAERWLAGGQTA